ncbi:alcohol acetyltransferase [Trichoderma arundinaceum]|uniref:Alcohol acetyltransferase n=1 Tax=Trichoderma arundinaceum TaxID=490622 RepID=A0A395NUK5_TRIAR|nr:alcohol acetyltransferase [Trichoderma arundinaceum]
MKVIRSASVNERRWILSETLGMSNGIVSVATYTGAQSDRGQLHASIEKAINRCVDEHPALRTIVQDADGGRPQFAQVDNIDLTQHLEYIKSPNTAQDEKQQIDAFIEAFHDTRLPPPGTQPQWRIYISETQAKDACRFHLAFASSHVLIDGLSSLSFQSTFLRSMNGFETSENPQPDKTILPSIEGAGKLKISWSYLLSILFKEFFPSWLVKAFGVKVDDLTKVWTGPKSRPSAEFKTGIPPTGFELALIPDTTVQRALKVCRIHDARLTGLLNFLIARALHKSLKARGQTYDNFIVGTAVDLRKALGHGNQRGMANWVSAHIETITVAEHEDDNITDEIWEGIKQSTAGLAKTAKTAVDQPIALLKYISNLKQWLESRAIQPSTASFGTSNLGAFDGTASEGTWKVDMALLYQSGNRTGTPFDIMITSAKNGSMSLIITWWIGMLGVSDEKVFMREIMAEIKAGLERAK